VKHLQPLGFQADFLQQVFRVFHPLLGSQISFQEMAVTDGSAAHQQGVGPPLEGLQHVLDIDLAGAQVFDDPYIVRVLEPQGAGHVRRRIGAVGADHGDEFGFERGLHQF
jgi:hypothetical protein